MTDATKSSKSELPTRKIVVGSIWKHWKGTYYKVLGFVRYEPTNTWCVRYQQHQANGVMVGDEWVREPSAFLDDIWIQSEDGLVKTARFRRVQ